jgi:predicted DNA-binding protein
LENIIFRINKELKDQLKKEAKERGLTLAAYIKSIIAERDR